MNAGSRHEEHHLRAVRTAVLEQSYHEARVLLLIDAFTRPKRGLEGMTKLAKLDFLLRYPIVAERLLDSEPIFGDDGPSEAELGAVESRMIRYKYGPWDHRYYVVVAGLLGKSLIENLEARRVHLRATQQGHKLATELAGTPEWAQAARRARILRRRLDRPGRTLKEMIYSRLPEVVDLPIGTEIAAVPPRAGGAP